MANSDSKRIERKQYLRKFRDRAGFEESKVNKKPLPYHSNSNIPCPFSCTDCPRAVRCRHLPYY